MRTTQEKTGVPTNKKKTDHLCGRLILWDAGTSREDLVILGTDYCHTRYDFSPQNKPKPCLPFTSGFPETGHQPISAIKVAAIQKALERFKLTRAQRASQLCGRLILWDAGTPHENLVMLAADYCHARHSLPTRNEL